MSLIKNKLILKCILIFSILALLSAYFIQYILDHQPCNLCLIERIPYYAAIILISLLLVTNKNEKVFLYTITSFFIFGTIVSFYHFGIEQGFFNESLICNIGKKLSISSANELLQELQKKTISCKNATFTLFGISLAAFNVIVSLAISIIMIKITKKYGKN